MQLSVKRIRNKTGSRKANKRFAKTATSQGIRGGGVEKGYGGSAVV